MLAFSLLSRWTAKIDRSPLKMSRISLADKRTIRVSSRRIGIGTAKRVSVDLCRQNLSAAPDVSSRSPSAAGCGGLRGPDILTGLPGRLKQPLGVFPALGAASNSGGGRISITGFGLRLTGLKQNLPSFGTLRLRFARQCLRDQRAPAAGKDAPGL